MSIPALRANSHPEHRAPVTPPTAPALSVTPARLDCFKAILERISALVRTILNALRRCFSTSPHEPARPSLEGRVGHNATATNLAQPQQPLQQTASAQPQRPQRRQRTAEGVAATLSSSATASAATGGFRPLTDAEKTSQPLPQTVAELQLYLEQNCPPIGALPITHDNWELHHAQAKAAFVEALSRHNNLVPGSAVRFVKAAIAPLQNPLDLTQNLDPSLFSFALTTGIQHDIPAAARQNLENHLFCLASQLNAAEAPYAFTPLPGKAMSSSNGDNTQGPLGERTNPPLFELITAYLTNMGYNMLAHVLSEVGSRALGHGYLSPSNNGELESIVTSLREHSHEFESPCIRSVLPSASTNSPPHNPIHFILSAAPALGRYCPAESSLDAELLTEMQYRIAHANFTTQLNALLELALEDPSKPWVYHGTGVGLGVFGNNQTVVGNAFKQAGLHFQARLGEIQAARQAAGQTALSIRLQFDVYAYADPPSNFLAAAGLQQSAEAITA